MSAGPKMEGFLVLDPNAKRDGGDRDVYLFEIMSALSATSLILSEYEGDDDREDGLRQAVRILVMLLKGRYTGEDAVKAPWRRSRGPRPPDNRPRRRKPRSAAVVSLVQSGDPAACAA
jgi:hypothetical protein